MTANDSRRSRPIILAALALVLVASSTATHAPPSFTIQSSTAWTGASFDTSIGTLQGVAYDGTSYYVSATSALAKYDATGARAWLTDTGSDGSTYGSSQTDVTYHAGKLYVGHKGGTSTDPEGYIGVYDAATGAYQQEIYIGKGTPSAITHARGAFWIAWTPDGTNYAVLERGDSLEHVGHYPLPSTYDANTGPQGIAWVDTALLLPRHADGGAAHGIDVYRFQPTHPERGFTFVHTMPYASWTTPAGRQEVSSQGIDLYRDHNRWSIVAAGRDAATGNGGGTGGVRHVALDLDRTQAYDTALLTVGSPATWTLTNGTLQGVAHSAAGTFVTTTNGLLRLDSGGAVTASRDTTADGAATQNGDAAVLGDRVFIHTSDYPASPRQAYVAAYNASSLSFIEEKPLGNRDGAGGGIAAWNGRLWAPVNQGLGGDLAMREIDPATLAVTTEYDLGHFGSTSPQGISILNGTAFIPHGNVGSLDALDGWLIFTWTGTTWTFHGTLAYPSWTGADGLTRFASQGIHFDVAQDCTVSAWSVGRYFDGHGHGAGEVARHPVTLGTLDACPTSGDDPPDDDPPPNDDDPPANGGVDEPTSRWPIMAVGVAAVVVVALAAWRFRSSAPAPDAPSDRALLVGFVAALVITAAALVAWPYIPLPEAWT